MDLTVLGCSGSYAAPAGGACSSYLVRHANTALWVDAGNGSFAALQREIPMEQISAVVITHRHPDHCVDLFSLFIAMKYGTGASGLPVYAAPEVQDALGPLIDHRWGDTFDWRAISDGQQVRVGDIAVRFARTDHPPPTFAVECSADGRRIIYSSDTGPQWSPAVFGPGADLVVCEAPYQDADDAPPFHCSASQAAHAARAAQAKQLMITHLWPTSDPQVSVAEAQAAFGGEVLLAAPHVTVSV
ncbi:MAG: MBL fold metallo-hydrolase [Acidimicrobiia bacterium]